MIELGKYKLKYVVEHVPQVDAADFEKTMVLRPGALKPAGAPETGGTAGSSVESTQTGHFAVHAAAATAQAAPAAPTAVALIQVLNGPNAGRELELTKTLTTLGKPGVQVAVIARRPNGYFITHVEGGQFPVVNGKTLDAQAHQLGDHDVIEIAGIKMEFFFKT